eukprot:7081237-Alexandrium_andersonii.AAC.1
MQGSFMPTTAPYTNPLDRRTPVRLHNVALQNKARPSATGTSQDPPLVRGPGRSKSRLGEVART